MDKDKDNISFGAIESFDDPRTLASSSFAAAALPFEIPKAAKVPLDYPRVDDLCDQRKLGVCTACGVRMAAESHFKDGARLDEYWLYLMGKTLVDDVQFGSHFEGSSALTMLKAANKWGVPTAEIRELLPLKVDGTYDQFVAHFRDVYGGKIPQAVLDDAAARRIPGYARIPNSEQHLHRTPAASAVAAEIARGRVVVGRFAVGKNLYRDRNGKPTRKAKDLLPLRAPEPAESGHIMDLSEYWDYAFELGGPNSWSRTWCPDNAKQEPGYFWFRYNDQVGFFTEAWVIVGADARYVFGKDLTVGSTGPDVVALQKLLVKLGLLEMPAGVPHGFFGERTRAAVARYQAMNKITPVAGYFGPKTRAHVNANQ
jgi:hypothetical protein